MRYVHKNTYFSSVSPLPPNSSITSLFILSAQNFIKLQSRDYFPVFVCMGSLTYDFKELYKIFPLLLRSLTPKNTNIFQYSSNAYLKDNYTYYMYGGMQRSLKKLQLRMKRLQWPFWHRALLFYSQQLS